MMIATLQRIDLDTGGILLVHKPLRWTSFDVINKIKRELKKLHPNKKCKIGHAGTLDPLADGLLIICIGKYTKRIQEFQHLNKRYTATLVVGASTKSHDLEHEPENFRPYDALILKKVEEIFQSYIGQIKQTPPHFSAVKIKGKASFEYARKGQEVELTQKDIVIHSIRILRFDLPEIEIEISCSKGTYIRSLVRDVGEDLGCGAYLSALRRTAIGDFTLENALTMNDWLDKSNVKPLGRKKKRFEL